MLKQLKLRKELELKKQERDALISQEEEFKKRSEELEEKLENAKTEGDFSDLSDEIEELEKDKKEAEIEKKKTLIDGEIERIESELTELEEKVKDINNDEKRSENKMNRAQIRELLKTGEYYLRSEVKEFYDKFKNLRSVGGEGLTIPQVVIDRIMDIVGDYSTLYPLVDKIKVKGTARILIDTDTTPATWIEQTGTIPTGNVGTITNVDFDGFKVGKITFVDNAILQDSIINLDDYVTKKIARAIALALDNAILNGTGSTYKQPEGIIPNIPQANLVTVTSGRLIDIIKPIAKIDTGDDSIGEIVAVMKRSTYYDKFLEYSINVNAEGNVVGKLPNLSSPDLLGLRVVFNNHMPADKVLFGEYEKYTLVEREDITIDKSEHVKFAEDQMAFRGKGRFDGKPTKPSAFVLVTLGEPTGGSTVTFSVYDNSDGDALAGATVTLCGETETTDENGIATFTSIPNGKHNYSVALEDYNTKTSTVTVAGVDREIEVKLIPTPEEQGEG
jgi:HK97 family phage major capsid protein